MAALDRRPTLPDAIDPGHRGEIRVILTLGSASLTPSGPAIA